MLAARPGLQEEVEAETAVERKAQLATESRIGNRENAVAEQTVASLEQLVAEKAEEIRLRSLDEESRKDHGSGSSTGGVVGVGSGGIGKGAGDQMGAAGECGCWRLFWSCLGYRSSSSVPLGGRIASGWSSCRRCALPSTLCCWPLFVVATTYKLNRRTAIRFIFHPMSEVWHRNTFYPRLHCVCHAVGEVVALPCQRK